MKLQFFSNSLTKILREEAKSNLPIYGSDCSWLESFAGTGSYLHDSKHVVDPPPILLLPDEDGNLHDAENARRIFTWLKDLSPSTAMEERLWACLTHAVFPEYMAKRWPALSANIVGRRYLLEGQSFAALSRNGISRLWWAGYLTHDSSRKNPFELTDVLFSNQDIQVGLLERALGKCTGVRMAVLRFFLKGAHLVRSKLIQRIFTELNLLGGVVILDSLPPDRLDSHLERIAADVAKANEMTPVPDEAPAT